MPRIKCENIVCEYNEKEKCTCKNTVNITYDGEFNCGSFKKSFHYYFNKVWNLICSSNMIQYPDLTEDVKIGLYYVMELYHLKLCEAGHGYWKFMTLSRADDEKNIPLNYEDIIKLEMDTEKLNYHYSKFNNGILPPYEPVENIEAKVDFQPYGYISSDGTFFEGDWGSHEELAFEIIIKNNWIDEYNLFKKREKSNYAKLFLINEKGYCLIHNPCNVDYMVINKEPLTSKQKTFLYNYFIEMGNKLAAEEYR